MPRKLVWNDRRDEWLKELRHRGHSWDGIASMLSITRNAAMERARRVHALLPRPQPGRPDGAPAEALLLLGLLEDPDRPPLPAGHPVAWTVLVEGTSLAETPYPKQPPMGHARVCVLGEVC
jgi:hypothetical protein